MGNWIKWEKGLEKRGEVARMADILDEDHRVVACACMLFWAWIDDETTDGTMRYKSVTGASRACDFAAGIKGFAAAMIEVGWLVISEDGLLEIPRFDRHNSKTAKERALNHSRNEKYRGDKKRHASVAPTVTEASRGASHNRERVESKNKEDIVVASATTRSAASPPTSSRYSSAFEKFWEVYPRHSAKGRAAKAFEQHVKLVGTERELMRPEAVAWLVAAAVEYAASQLVRSLDADKVPHAATWLNDRRYDDDRSEWQRARDGPSRAAVKQESEFKF